MRHHLHRRYGRAAVKTAWQKIVAQRERNLTDDEIEKLRQAAGRAGDTAQVRLCDCALRGNRKARLACADAIADWELR